MTRNSTPLEYWGNAVQFGSMMAEAQSVIAMRMLGIAGLWSVAPDENKLMVSEKVSAISKGLTDASRAIMEGKRLDEIAAAAIKPIRQTTRANHKRLSNRGLTIF